MERFRSVLPRVALGWAVVFALTVPSAMAQRLRVRGAAAAVQSDSDADDASESSFAAPDRTILQQMNRAREALKEGHYAEAVEGLDKVLKCSEDYFSQPDKKAPIYRSLKAEARQLIGQMPPEGRALYELRCGSEARDMLNKGIATGEADRLAEVSGQYFHTRAGYEATFLLGLYNLDRGSPLAGALMLRRLREAPEAGDRFEPALSLTMASCWLQAGMPDDASRALVALRQRLPKMMPIIGGRQVPWFEQPTEAVAWLGRLGGPQRATAPPEADRWAMYRGDAARNAATIGGAPLLNMRWRVPILDEPILEDILRQNQQAYRDQGVTLVSSLHPLAVDDVVLMRDAWHLWAIDFQTGKRLWTTRSLDEDPWQPITGGRANAEMYLRQQQSNLVTRLGQRIWDDATYGTLSSDGRLVFAIEDLGLGLGVDNSQAVFVGGGFAGPFGRQGTGTRGPYNRLAAYNIRTGKIEWELGGAPGSMALPLAETFFLGPPLPLRGQLYVLAEAKDEIRLLVLDPANKGKILWSQQLTMVERNVSQDPGRRFAGVSPSYADGILVCPTGAGSVVAVDLATRSLLWGYRYQPAKDTSANAAMIRQQQMMAMRFNVYNNIQPMQRWLDGTATVVDGRVILTPAESDALYCLKLIDGQPAWEPTARRPEDLYVACVHKGMAIVAGRRELRAIQIADGKPAWEGRKLEFPAGSALTGRGFYTGNQYYAPLSSAEVLAVDLDAGKTARVAKSRKGNVPGNLVCYKGKVISQGMESVETFYQIDAAREEILQKLAANPNDPEALSLRGEMLMDEGKFGEAVAAFRRAHDLDADPRTRELLRDALLDGLRTDFAAHRKFAPDIEKLLDDATQRAAYLRLMAAGLQQAGEWRAALDEYLKLADLDPSQRPLEPVDKLLLVRRDRWLQARLAALRTAGGAEAAAEIDKTVAARLKTAVEIQGVESLRRFLDYFGNQPAAAAARREYLSRLAQGGRLLEAELLLWPDRESKDRATAGAALAELAELFARGGKAEAASACYRQLADEFADVVCRDGKTGKQLFDALAQDSPVRKAVAERAAWPVGLVDSRRGTHNEGRTSVYGRFYVQFRGNPGPFYANTSLRYDQNRQTLMGNDDQGREKWQVQLMEPGQRINFGYNPNMTQARTQGHLVLLSVGTKIIGLDPQSLSGNNSKVLWTQDITDASADSGRAPRVVVRAGGAVLIGGNVAFQQPFAVSSSSYGMNLAGPVTSRYIAFQRYRNVVAVDPLSGESLWVRQDIPPNSDIFGDEQYVFVLPPDQSEALVFRAEDGELLGKRTVKRPANRQGYMSDGVERSIYVAFNYTNMTAIGRYLLKWEEEDGGRVLKLFDPWEQKELWPARKFASGAKVALVGDEAVGIFEPDGHFVLVSLPGGRTIADVKLQPESSLSEIFVLRMGQQYLLLTHDARVKPQAARQMVQPLPGMLYQSIRRGRLYALDLQGKPVWPAPVTIEDQHLLLNQPAGLPILAFACQKYEQRKDGQMWAKTALVCVDRRTGRIVYNENTPNPTMSLDIVGNPEQKTVDVRMQNGAVVLNFTDKALPPPKPGGETNFKPGQGKVSEAVVQAIAEPLGGTLETMGKAVEFIVDEIESRLSGDDEPAPVPAPRVKARPARVRQLR